MTISRMGTCISLSLSLSIYLSRSPRGLCVCLLMCVSRCVCRLCVSPMMCMCTTTTVCVSRCVCHGVTSMLCVSSVYIFVRHSVTVCVCRRGCVMHIPTYSPPCSYILLFNNFKSQVVTGVSVVDNPLRGCLPFHG